MTSTTRATEEEDEIVKFATTKGGLGGIVAANMDNALK